MEEIRFFTGKRIPLEMHKVQIVQKLELVPATRRLTAMEEAGYNTFLLKNEDVFLDMLTDSGVNAMSDRQQAAMLQAEDSYAGSRTFTRLSQVCEKLFGTKFFLPAHQGRACENIIARTFVKPGSIVLTNYHFTTTLAHIVENGGSMEELYIAEALNPVSDHPFKGNMDLGKLKSVIKDKGAARIPFVRMEAGTNLIGGQPFSLENLKAVGEICRQNGIPLVLDGSLLADNLYFIKTRERQDLTIEQITKEMLAAVDLMYFSGRKLGCARGGGLCTNSEKLYIEMRELVTMYEGFLTYGGMSVREMEAMAVGLEETMDFNMVNQGPQFIAYMVDELQKHGVPVVTPAGGLGCHLNAKEFVPQLAQEEYPAGALAAALYLVSGVRGMERGTMSEARDAEGNETLSALELVRLALPRRVFTLSQVQYVVDRIVWLFANRELIGGLEFVEEPSNLRFFFGRLAATSDWPEQLVAKFRAELGEK